MSAGIRFIEGFEGDEDSRVWERMGLTRSEAHARSGDFGIGVAGLGYPRSESPLFPVTGSVIVGFAFRNSSASSWGSHIAIFEIHGPGDYAHVYVGLDSQKLLGVYARDEIGAWVLRAVSTRQLDDDAWYYIEVGIEGHASTGRVVVQLNGPAGTPGSTGAEIIDISGIRTFINGVPALAEAYNQFHVGAMTGFASDSRTMSWDDFYVRDFDEGFLGDQAVIALDLEDDRSVDFTRLSGPKNYQMVDELAPDEDTTYNESDVDDAEDVFEVADSVFAGTIHALQLVARARKTQTQVWTLNTVIDLGGTQSVGPDYYLPFPDYETLPPDVYGDAPGETGWTLAQLNAIGVGYQIEEG